MDLLIFGIQGSGKGTQAKLLAEKYGCLWFDTGAELRRLSETDTPLGRAIAGKIDHGNLVTNEITMELTRASMLEVKPGQPVLFDGIPRYMEQKITFDAMLREMGREVRGITIDVDENAAIKRILERGKTGGRIDDQDETFIKNRIEWSKKKTFPVIAAYESEGIIARVDGNGTPEEVHERVLVALEKVGFLVP
jgi:adenylate kinase